MKMLRNSSITIAAALVTAAVLLIPTILLAKDGEKPAPQSATPPPLEPLTPAGPKKSAAGVPLITGRPLGPANSPRRGETRGGIPCGSTEQLSYHVHARLTIFVNGKPRPVPPAVGIGANSSCFSFLHTHAADGIVHIEAPTRINFSLGQLFDVWQQKLGSRRLGRARGRVVAYVNGRRFRGDPRAILLRRHTQIQLQVGQPLVAPEKIRFPAGL